MRTKRRYLIGASRGCAVAALLCWAAGSVSADGAEVGRRGSTSAGAPVDAIFVLDNSGSMRTNDPDLATWRIVTDFALGMPQGGRLGLVLFDDTARLVEPLTSAIGTDSASHWMRVMGQLDYAGQRTNSPAGIERALYELKHSGRDEAEHVIVFVTDGIVDTGDPRRDVEKTRWLKDELAAEARRAGVRVYGIAFTDAADVELIQALALVTGGDYWRVQRADDFGALLAPVLAEVLADAGRRAPGASRTVPAPEAIRREGQSVRIAASAEPSEATPPVSAAPPDRGRGLLLLSVGLALGALVVAYPLIDRRRRRLRTRPSAFAGLPARPLVIPPLPALPRAGRPPIVKLVDESDAMGQGQAVLLLEKPSTTIGRDPKSDVSLPNDTVSSLHATIEYRDGYFYVQDRRSTNGTSLNGQRLAPTQAVQLKSGDLIDAAGCALRFLIPDHEPRGRTLALGGTRMPGASQYDASDASKDPDANDGPGTGGGRDADAGLDASPSSDLEQTARWVAAFDQCLGAHLTKIESLGTPQRLFVERAFPLEVRALLARRAQELIERCQREKQGEQLDVSRSGIHYTICAVPDEMGRARSWYASRHGGYAKFLVGLLDAWTNSGRSCDAVCVITFGMTRTPWLSITVMPARDDSEAIEVMSYEFLSEDERRKALDLAIIDVSKSV